MEPEKIWLHGHTTHSLFPKLLQNLAEFEILIAGSASGTELIAIEIMRRVQQPVSTGQQASGQTRWNTMVIRPP